MTALEPILERLGLLEYYDAFVAEGFDTWETILDIKETDLESLHVKRGHRRKLQRAIAEFRGIANTQPLSSPSLDTTSLEGAKNDTTPRQVSQSKDGSTPATEQKRKYRRHPKVDEHAPEKPPSAYVLFSNRIREEVKGENLSFTDIARLVGERWQKLDRVQKEKFESHAATLKDAYNSDMAEYKKTEEYSQYMDYLADFKAKHSGSASGEAKRPKLDSEASSSLSATSHGDFSEQVPRPFEHSRGGSIGSASTSSYGISPLPLLNAGLQLTMSPPNSALPVGRPSLPLGLPPRLRDQNSTQNSYSEESGLAGFAQRDSISGSAHLTLSAMPNGVVGVPASNTPAYHQDDPGIERRGSASQWLGIGTSHSTSRFPANDDTPGNKPSSSFPNNSLVGSETWRERGIQAGDLRRPWPPEPAPTTGNVPISRIVDSSFASDGTIPTLQRTLPPLRKSSSTPQESTTSLMPIHAPTLVDQRHQLPFPEPLNLRNSHQRHPSHLSDSEAADTLMGLAERPQSQDN